ncbi:MAG: plastocyanin/azurin family copper-binding protein [Acidobacteriota bacterium]
MRKLTTITLISAAVLAVAVVASARPRATKNRTASANAPLQAKATVKISSFKFEPKVLTVAPGTTVEWINDGGRHSVVADDGSFKSDALKQGDKFEHKFDKAGSFAYHCEFHGEKGGKDMAGKIVVRRGAK